MERSPRRHQIPSWHGCSALHCVFYFSDLDGRLNRFPVEGRRFIFVLSSPAGLSAPLEPPAGAGLPHRTTLPESGRATRYLPPTGTGDRASPSGGQRIDSTAARVPDHCRPSAVFYFGDGHSAVAAQLLNGL